MKGLPLAYSKDMQEDKEQVFDAADSLMLAIAAMVPAVVLGGLGSLASGKAAEPPPTTVAAVPVLPPALAAPVLSGNDTLARLADVIAQRRGGDPDKSYVARLFTKGNDAILKKIGEEATEVVMAAKDGDPKRVVAEVADLWFHTMIALAAHGLRPADVLAELERREGISGLEEFAARKLEAREKASE